MERTRSRIEGILVSSKQPINKTNFLNVYIKVVSRKLRVKNNDLTTSKLGFVQKICTFMSSASHCPLSYTMQAKCGSLFSQYFPTTLLS